jgi:hypothetical protein
MTEGEYGNPSVVRRQTTDAKLTELKRRLFPSLVGGIFGFANYVYYSLSGAQQRDLNSVARKDGSAWFTKHQYNTCFQ